MVEIGFKKPNNAVIQGPYKGGSPLVEFLDVGTVANMYPGRLVQRENTDYDTKVGGVGSGNKDPFGWLGYEQASDNFRPATRATIYVLDDVAPVHSGAGFRVRASLAAGFTVNKGDLLGAWSNGEVMGPLISTPAGLALRIPFTKNASELDTSIDIAAGIMAYDAFVDITTLAASSTVDFGILSGEAGGDADGFLDGVSGAAAGVVYPDLNDTTEANLTLGVLLGDHIKSGDTTPEFSPIRKAYIFDGTAKSLTYTTSNHSVAGNLYLTLGGPGFMAVARAEETVDASAAAAAIWARSLI